MQCRVLTQKLISYVHLGLFQGFEDQHGQVSRTVLLQNNQHTKAQLTTGPQAFRRDQVKQVATCSADGSLQMHSSG